MFNERYAVSEVSTMGHDHVVFGATDRKGGGQQVLLRVMMPPVLHHAPTVERFKKRVQEARKASPLRSRPSIDAGESKDGTLYFVCKRPPGHPLEQHVAMHADGRLAWVPGKKLLQSLVEVLKAAHDRNVVHGGLALDSFWIEEPRGAGPVAYLVDLGAGFGEAGGTTGDPRTDVQLLGALACFVLTGGPMTRGRSWAANLAIPREAKLLLERMSADDAAERPQPMAELKRELAGLPDVVIEDSGPEPPAEAREEAEAEPLMPPAAAVIPEPLPADDRYPIADIAASGVAFTAAAQASAEPMPVTPEVEHEPPLVEIPPSPPIEGTLLLSRDDLAKLHYWKGQPPASLSEPEPAPAAVEQTICLPAVPESTVRFSQDDLRRMRGEDVVPPPDVESEERTEVFDPRALRDLRGEVEQPERPPVAEEPLSREGQSERLTVDMIRALRAELARRDRSG